jgi:cobalt-zinc-cadmium efflux system protein
MKLTDNCDHNHSHAPEVTDSVFKIGISLNLLFVIIEIYFGIVHDSLALVSDAVHNLTDVFGLLLAWLGFALSKSIKGKKFSIYAAVINTGLLLITSVWIIKEAYERYYAGETPVALTMIVVALVGCAINFFTAKQFHKDHHHDLNMKSAYLHLMADAAISLGVVVAGVVIYYTSFYWIDAVVSALISIVIIYTSWSLFRESLNLVLGKTPKNINIEELKKQLLLQGEISEASKIRVWALSTSENALSAQLQLRSPLTENQLEQLKQDLQHRFKITQFDFSYT